jgi:site-specific recombinase XerD
MLDSKLDSVKINFIKYLDSLGLSSKSHKNYRSDLNHFVAWAILKMRSFGSFIENLTEAVPFLNPDIAKEYMSFMKLNNSPEKTINRRLSTLRHLSRFLTASQIIDSDFMSQIENISHATKAKPQIDPIIKQFRAQLEAEKVSPNTIKNYLSDVRQFLSWLEANNQTQIH